MIRFTSIKTLALASLSIALTGCAEMPVKVGDDSSKTVATGSAGGASSQNASSQLESCGEPLGTMALYEQKYDWYYSMRRYGLQSTVPVLRLLAQQSNCFVVVERGRAFKNIEQERKLEESGELRTNSNFGKGQLVSADFTLTPSLTFSESNTGGLGGLVGGVFGSVGSVVGGSLKFGQASSLLTLVDNRSGVQLIAAEGSAKGSSVGGFGGLFGRKLGGAMGAYAKTPEAKVIVASMMDAFNSVVIASRSYVAQEIQGQGLGTGGKLGVDGGTTNASTSSQTAVQSSSSGGNQSIMTAQKQLNALGYDAGSADGVMGNKTRTAISQFQEDNNLKSTGRLDLQTKSALEQLQ
ncbi:MAG: peptidoglycan-binding protein [Acidiferrobacterales bacterium]|nr:peptidoglycan-binding protein [Acidiferrobacterales bacterium]